MNIEDLKSKFSGEVITKEDPNYDEARTSYVGKSEPLIVLRPKTNADVALGIKYAKENSLIFSVKSGGHNNIGSVQNKDGVVMDLMNFNQIEIEDLENKIIKVGTATKWGDIAEKLHEHNLGMSSGDTKSVGVGGLTLGGGIGLIVRKHGLAIDNLIGAEIVTADGEVLHLSENENEELFWAIRGGGGNFGVVTNFEFKVYDLGKIYSGIITLKLENVEKVLQGWRDQMRKADDNLTTSVIIMPSFGPEIPAAINIMCYYAEDNEAKAMAAINPLKELGVMVNENITRKDYFEALEEAHPPQGVKITVKNILTDDFSDELIKNISNIAGDGKIFLIRSTGRKMNETKTDKTAFAHRNSEALIVLAFFSKEDASDEEVEKDIEPWKLIKSFGVGAYVNFLSTNTEDDIKFIYPKETLEKLRQIKKRYDPENLFNQNFNIRP